MKNKNHKQIGNQRPAVFWFTTLLLLAFVIFNQSAAAQTPSPSPTPSPQQPLPEKPNEPGKTAQADLPSDATNNRRVRGARAAGKIKIDGL